jgi:hypothetical protein
MKIICSSIIIFLMYCNSHYLYGVEIDSRIMGGAVGAEMADFIGKLALEEEKEDDRDWYRIRSDFYVYHKHSPLSFDEVLGTIDTLYLSQLANNPKYQAKLKNYENLPFPAVWKLLDRKKPIRIWNLNRFHFGYSRPDPEDEDLIKKLISILGTDREKAKNEEKARRKDNSFIEEDVLMYIKLSLLKWLESSPKNNSNIWTEDAQKNSVNSLQKMFAGTPDTAEKWYLKEGTRRALLAITEDKDIKDQIKTSVWETPEFLDWLKKAEKDYKLPSSEK